MNCNFFTDRNAALEYLIEKYEVSGRGTISQNSTLETTPVSLRINNNNVALLPWRMERRFIELKKLIEEKTLEDISTFRFAHLASGDDKTLDALIYQELDLCEWLGGAPVKRLFAVFSGEKAVNIIAKLENDFSCSVECSVMLPKNADTIDRHEIIARRGVASDRVVDTQVPQSSIYTYNGNEEKRFTDVDAELFGLSGDDVNLVRAAFKVLNEPDTEKNWNSQHNRLLELIEAAKESETTNKPSIIKGGI